MMATDMVGVVKKVQLLAGPLHYREAGDGPPLVFVHGPLVNGVLWRNVVASLADSYRCIVPDLPLGAHAEPMHPDADLTPGGVADLLAAFLAALDLQEVTLVGNDSGGAICQILIARDAARIGRLVLTNCDAYEAFFPAPFGFLHHAPRLFGERSTALLGRWLQRRWFQRLLMWIVSRRRPPTWVLDAFFLPLRDPAIRRDLTKFLATVSNRYTLEAARSFEHFARPVLLVWGRDDPLFRPPLTRRLQRAFPDATLHFVPNSRAFVPEDQPKMLADLIRSFVPLAIDPAVERDREPVPLAVGSGRSA